jgi:flagellum-specific ATP synthase
MGDICNICLDDGKDVLSEVVGIKKDSVVLMPYQEAEGIGYGKLVYQHRPEADNPDEQTPHRRIIDAWEPPSTADHRLRNGVPNPVGGNHNNPMDRPPITQVIELGVRAIYGMITIGKGQAWASSRAAAWE